MICAFMVFGAALLAYLVSAFQVMSAPRTEHPPTAPTASSYGTLGVAAQMVSGVANEPPRENTAGTAAGSTGVEHPSLLDPAPMVLVQLVSAATTSTEKSSPRQDRGCQHRMKEMCDGSRASASS